MKLRRLPCSRCDGAWLAKSPYSLPAWPGRDPFVYRCVKCGTQYSLSNKDFLRLPAIEQESEEVAAMEEQP